MNTQNENVNQKSIAPEFASWPMTEAQVKSVTEIRHKFDELLDMISMRTPFENARYLALVKTKLEEASFFAVKGVAKPTTSISS